MKKILCVIFAGILLSTIGFSLIGSAEPMNDVNAEDDLKLSLFGYSVVLGPRSVGFILNNIGDSTIEDISWSFSTHNDAEDGFNMEISDVIDEIGPGESTIFSIKLESDFGIIDLKASANCSQTGEMSDSIKIFQLGPLSIGRPFALSYIMAS